MNNDNKMPDYGSLLNLLQSNRSYRRFRQNSRIGTDTLERLVDAARYCASGRNLQPLKYRLVNAVGECEAIFPLTKWAGYLNDWGGPAEGERPAAYLVQCLDTDLATNQMCDDGLEIEAITLVARTLGLGGCIIKSFEASSLAVALSLPEQYKPLYVIALGYPVERVEIVPCCGDIKYYRDPHGTHFVPKRSLEERIVK